MPDHGDLLAIRGPFRREQIFHRLEREGLLLSRIHIDDIERISGTDFTGQGNFLSVRRPGDA